VNRRDDELEEELATHLRMAAEDRVAHGESPAEAELAARREFGNVTLVREVTREIRRGIWLERLLQDVRYGLRALRRTPTFSVVAILTLALAVGANSAVFTVVNGVLLRPLPFRDPGALHLVSYLPTELPFEISPSLPDRLYLAYRERARTFERVAAYQRSQVTLSGAGDAARLSGARVGADFFGVLGVAPVVGRGFVRDEERPGHDRVVILSDRVWRARFGADSTIVGRAITLDGTPHVVVGVMPPAFTFPASAELWTPLSITLDRGNSFIYSVVGRLRDGRTRDQARVELQSIARSIPRDPRDRDRTMVAAIIPLKDVLTAKVEPSLLVFSGAIAFVLLIACANIANLLLIRAATRRHDMAVRVALGASRPRVVRQLLTESLLVAIIGGGVGVLVSLLGVRALLSIAPPGRIPRLDEIHVDAWVLAFTLGLSLVTGVLFGMGPALAGARHQPREALAQGARALGGRQGRIRAALVTAEIALALVLLAGAGLMIKSFVRMRTVDTGFDARQVVTMSVSLPRSTYANADRIHAFHTSLLDRLSQAPGVRAVGAVSSRPMAAMGIMGDFKVDGPTPLPNGYNVDKPTVSPGYFAALGIRLQRGRDFSPRDNARAPGVVIVSESVARRVWGDRNPIGKRISMQDRPTPQDWVTVIGVVDDVLQDGTLTKHSTIYLPYRQARSLFFIDHMTFVVRAERDAERLIPAMREALREIDPTVPAEAVQTMDTSLLEVIAEPLFQTRLLAVFSLLALLLAAVGTYGVLAYDVTERTREIGRRIALGATPGAVMRMVMRRTASMAITGAAIGLVASLALDTFLTRALYDVTPGDPATMAVVVLAIVTTALLAGYVPARRATRISTLTALSRD
jgi:predicted permease